MLLTANEAHAQTKQNLKERDNKFRSYLRENIEKEINRAVEKGEFYAQLYYHKDNPAHQFLPELIQELVNEYGFKATIKKPKNNENNWFELKIKW